MGQSRTMHHRTAHPNYDTQNLGSVPLFCAPRSKHSLSRKPFSRTALSSFFKIRPIDHPSPLLPDPSNRSNDFKINGIKVEMEIKKKCEFNVMAGYHSITNRY